MALEHFDAVVERAQPITPIVAKEAAESTLFSPQKGAVERTLSPEKGVGPCEVAAQEKSAHGA